MKVGELIEALKQFDTELEVQVFHDIGAMTIDGPELYHGKYEDPDNKKLFRVVEGYFVGIGNPADFDLDEDDEPLLII